MPELVVFNVSTPTLMPFLPDPAKATGAAMVVVPGGGFIGLAIDREGHTIARWLNERGIAAFVLKYRVAPTLADPQALAKTPPKRVVAWRETPSGTFAVFPEKRIKAAVRAAQEDALEAIRYVRAHAAEWKLSPGRIRIMGFSAGAITSVNVAANADADSRPDLVAPIYGAVLDGTKVPPTA